MDFNEMPLKIVRMKRRAISSIFGNSATERSETSKIYIKHLNSLRKQNHISLLISEKREKIVNRDVLHSRFGYDYDKLYDTSPRRKKMKLKDARTNSKSSLKVIDNRIGYKSLFNGISVQSLEQHLMKENKQCGNVIRKSVTKTNLKALLPKIRKNSIN